MAKGTEAAKKKYSEMSPAEQKAYKAELTRKLEANIDLINQFQPKGQKIANSRSKKKEIINAMLSDDRIKMHEKARDSKLGTKKDINDYKTAKCQVYNSYVPSEALPFEFERIITFMPKPEEGHPDNVKYNKELFEGLYRDDAVGEKKRHDFQLEFFNKAASVDYRYFTKKSNCTLDKFLDYGISNFEACGSGVDLGYVKGVVKFPTKEQAKDKMMYAIDYGNVIGGACKGAIAYASYEEFLTFPFEFLSEDQFFKFFSNVAKLTVEQQQYMTDFNFYKDNAAKAHDEAVKAQVKFPNGIVFTDEDIAEKSTEPYAGGYIQRKELLSDYCRKVRNLEGDNLQNLQDICGKIENTLNKQEILADEDVKDVIDLCRKHDDEYSKNGRGISSDNREKIKQYREEMKDTIKVFKKTGYLKGFVDIAREELQKGKSLESEQKDASKLIPGELEEEEIPKIKSKPNQEVNLENRSESKLIPDEVIKSETQSVKNNEVQTVENDEQKRARLVAELSKPEKFAEYKKNIADIAKDIKSTDDFYVWTNTTKFNEMRDATYALNKSMQAVKKDKVPSPEQIEAMADQLMQVSKKADAYAEAKLESIKKEMKEPENSPKQRSVHRLASAMNLKRLAAGEEPHPIGKDQFKEQVGVLLNDVNERFHRYDANQPVQHDDKKTRADVEKFAVALERYIDKHPKILDNGLLAQDKVNKLKANIQSGKQKEMEDPNLGAKTRSAGILGGPGGN